jgi:hypothetical protein
LAVFLTYARNQQKGWQAGEPALLVAHWAGNFPTPGHAGMAACSEILHHKLRVAAVSSVD